MVPVLYITLLFLAILGMVQTARGLYTSIHINSTMASDMCAPDIMAPTSSPNCVSQCRGLDELRISCSNLVGCLCRRAPPESFQQCIDCVSDNARDFPGTAQFQAMATAQVEDYAAICSITLSLPESIDGLNLTDLQMTSLSSACVPKDSVLPPSFLARPTFRYVYPYIAFMFAVVFMLYSVLLSRKL